MDRVKSARPTSDFNVERPSVVLFEPNAHQRTKFANFFKTQGLVVYEVAHAHELQNSTRGAESAPTLIVVKLNGNREALEVELHRLQVKYKCKIPVVVMANNFDSNDLMPLVQMGARSVLLNLDQDAEWQTKLRSTLQLVRPKFI